MDVIEATSRSGDSSPIQRVVAALAAEFVDLHPPEVVEVHVYSTYRALRPHLRVTLMDSVENWARQQLFATAFPGLAPQPTLTQMLCAPAM